MILFDTILGIVALSASCFALWKFQCRYRQRAIATVIPRLQRVDLAEFDQLTDPVEEAYLRQRYRRDFRRLQKDRIVLAIQHVRRMARNARVLVAAGCHERLSKDPARQYLGNELIRAAVQIRLYAFCALLKLYFWKWLKVHAWAIIPTPNLADFRELAGVEIVFAYDRLKSKAAHLSLLYDDGCYERVMQKL